MTDPDRLLEGLWAEDEPPARDAAFVIAVMETAARRRLLWRVLALAPLAAAASAVLWALGPVIGAALGGLAGPVPGQTLSEVAAALIMAVFLWSWVGGRLGSFDA